MDYSPNYLTAFDTVARVQQTFSAPSLASAELRFIAILRDPIERAVSFFEHFQPSDDINEWVNSGLAQLNSSRACDSMVLSKSTRRAEEAICAGAYVVHLRRWTAESAGLKPSQFLLLSFSKYIEEPGLTMAAIAGHVGVANSAEQQQIAGEVTAAAKTNTAESHQASAPAGTNFELNAETRAALDTLFRPYTQELQEWAGRESSQQDGIRVPFTSTEGPALF